MTPSRITGSALASALTIRGSSASSGSAFSTRPIESRASDAATLRSVASLNSTVTRLRPCDERAEIASTPEIRPMAPSITPVTSRSMVSGAAPSNSVVTVITGRSTSGSSRTSMPSMRAEPREHDQPVQHDREDRPPHEERREALRPAADVGPARHASARRPAGGGERRGLVALEAQRRARAQHLHALGHHPRPGGSAPSTSTASSLRCTIRTGTRSAVPSTPTQT